jgi:type II secretory pathway pseudopilin PulG
MKIKNSKGLTLLETLISVTLLSLLILGTTLYFISRVETMRTKKLGNDIVLILSAIDRKMQIDAYDTASWKKSSWNNKDEFINELVAKELRTSNSSCGVSGGWVTSLVKDPLTLVPCSRWSGTKLPFKIEVKAHFEKITNPSGTENISLFNIDYYLNSTDFEDNIRYLVKVKKSLDKYEDTKNLTVHTFNWIDKSTNEAIELEKCLDIKDSCILRTQIEVFTGISTDKIRLDGKNSLMGEIDFDNADNLCSEWVYNSVSSNWVSTKVKCSIKGGFDTDDLVEAKINNTTIEERISLKQKCNIYEFNKVKEANGLDEKWINPNSTEVPCGLTKSGSLITTGFEKTNAEIVIAEETIIENGKFKLGTVEKDANFYKNFETLNLSADKSMEAGLSTIQDETKADIIEIGSSVENSYVKNLLVAPNFKSKEVSSKTIDLKLLQTSESSRFNDVKLKDLGSSIKNNNVLVDTRNSNYVSTVGAAYSKIKGKIINDVKSSIAFYSGYTPINASDTTVEKTWNKLTMQNLSGKVPSIIGSTKDRNTFRTEMGNLGASDLAVDVFKDGRTFYSEPSTVLYADQLSSDGVLFTNSTPATGSAEAGYSLSAKSSLADEYVIRNGGIDIQRKGNSRVSVSNSGLMVLRGEDLGGGDTTAELNIIWPTTGEGDPGHNGFRNRVLRTSLTPIINGTTHIEGNVVQWKPFHVNDVHKDYNICDRPNGITGACLLEVWLNLNKIEGVLKLVKNQETILASKLPPLKGLKGEIGEQGFNGLKGLDGFKGVKGKRGPRGPMEYFEAN